jgi:hypothetical protein
VEVVDGRTGELRATQVFVAVLGASNYTYAEATWTQSLPDWTGSHVRTLEFLGGVPRTIVPDNLRAAVLRANWYEPGINPTYRDLAAHYGTAILPTRVRRPRDKAKVEAGVLVVERWILCPPNPSCMPNGASVASRSTTTSMLTVTTIRFRIDCCGNRSRHGLPPARSSCSTKASGSRCICAAARAVGIRRCPSTCRGRTGAMPSGRSSALAGRRPTSAECAIIRAHQHAAGAKKGGLKIRPSDARAAA